MLLQSHVVGSTNLQSTVTVTLYLNPRAPLPSPSDIGIRPLAARGYLARADYAAAHGADPAHVDAVKKFAAAHGLSVGAIDLARRAIDLTGTIDVLQAAFQVKIDDVDVDYQRFRTSRGPAVFPPELNDIVTGVFGLSDLPIARPHFRRAAPAPAGALMALSAGGGPMPPPQVAKLYNFPAVNAAGQPVNGAGQTIAIIELGGGYTDENLTSYFTDLGITKPPRVSFVSVAGGQNQVGSSADVEVQLDIEVAGAVAPGANIVVYFAPNTIQGFLAAVSQAVHDSVNNPTILSISWGSPESAWTADDMNAMDGFFHAAALMGMSVFVAAGDSGSSDGAAGTNVGFPASSPNCTACGGTTLAVSGATITSETVWNNGNGVATGGGVSAFFTTVPPYQKDSRVPVNPNTRKAGRGVPDICGDADPNTGYKVQINGQPQSIGGTSAVAPLWAGLTALLNQAAGTPLGFLNPALYGKITTAGALHDITQGNNITDQSRDRWLAGPGWDPCTGCGSPDGAAILKAVTS